MNIKQLNEELEKFLLHEMAVKNCCGLEWDKKTSNGDIKITDQVDKKISSLVKYVDKTERNNMRCYKISNAYEFTWNTVTYHCSICVGNSKEGTDVLAPGTKHGLFHMKYGKHWDDSKKALNKFYYATRHYQVCKMYKDDKITEDKTRVMLYDSLNKNTFIIGLANNEDFNETVLITCY